MQGVTGAFKIEKRFWGDMPSGNPSPLYADQWCMSRISEILNKRDGVLKRNEWDNTYLVNQIDEIHKAWSNIKMKIVQGGIPTIRIVLD
jgi:hypothetical protein